MTTTNRNTVFLDANVLRGIFTTNTLLTLAHQGLFEVRWSQYVLDEVARNGPPGLPRSKLLARLAQMKRAFPTALVSESDRLLEAIPAHSKDQPVLADARGCSADLLVTENLKDFWPGVDPRSTLLPVSVSEFLRGTLDLRPRQVVAVLGRMVSRNAREPTTLARYVEQAGTLDDLSAFAKDLHQRLPPHLRSPNLAGMSSPAELGTVGKAIAGRIPLRHAVHYERLRSQRLARRRGFER